MPDFAKALRQIRETGEPHPALRATLSKRERAHLPGREGGRRPGEGLSIADQLEFLRTRWARPSIEVQSAAAPAEILPPGEIESTRFGSHYVVQTVYPYDYFHGKVRLSRFSPADLGTLTSLMREEAAVPPRERIVFLDTETTGMQGGSGMCPFLAGIGYFAGDEFHMLQYFIRDFDEEPSMLYALGELLARFDLVVTHNGAAFDVPLLDAPFRLVRLRKPLHGMCRLHP